MPVVLKKDNNFLNMQAKDKFRLRDEADGLFLHASGTGKTTLRQHSWLGFAHQAETLEARAKARQDDWPFQAIPRTVVDRQPQADDL